MVATGAGQGSLSGPAAITLADRRLEPLPTPGHTRGHLCFLDAAAELLFAGDHVLPHITPSIGFEPAGNRMALRDYLSSLARTQPPPGASRPAMSRASVVFPAPLRPTIASD